MKSPRARFHSALIVAVIATFAGVPERTAFALPADLAHDLAGLAAADGRSVSEEGLLLLRRAVAGRQLREVLTHCGSDLDPDQAMQIALDEQRAHRRSR